MSAQYAELNSTVMGVTSLLLFSDKLVLAVDLELSIIENMPEASAWHRQVISLRLGKQLGRHDAEGMMRKFASFVFDAIEKQRKCGKVQPEPESDEDIDMLSDDESDAGSQEISRWSMRKCLQHPRRRVIGPKSQLSRWSRSCCHKATLRPQNLDGLFSFLSFPRAAILTFDD